MDAGQLKHQLATITTFHGRKSSTALSPYAAGTTYPANSSPLIQTEADCSSTISTNKVVSTFKSGR